jgi:hypothetical protein
LILLLVLCLIVLLLLWVIGKSMNNGSPGFRLNDVWIHMVYGSCFLSAYFVKAQQIFFKAIHLPQLGLQISVFCIIGWCWAVWQHHKQNVV